jgi:hypothetical protein
MDNSRDAVNRGVMTASMMMRARHRWEACASRRSPGRRVAAIVIWLPERR